MEHCIFHVDVNSAFLSWSAVRRLEEDPGAVDLRTIPSAVGGDVKTRHGIITAKSIPAKKYKIQTGEPVVKALQKCPGLVLIPSDFQTYRRYSRAFIGILHKYSGTVEQVSIDEAYMDMTESVCPETQNRPEACSEDAEEAQRKKALHLAEQIKNEIRDSLGFTVNVGISINRLLAKTASDFEKPDRIHTLYPEEVPDKMWPLPIRELHGCGGATSEKLNRVGIRTIGDAAHSDPELLRSLIGEKAGDYIYRSANGISRSSVTEEDEPAKSYSNETTTSEDITGENYRELAVPIVKRLSEKVSGRMKKDGVRAFTITVSVKTEMFRRHSRQTKLPRSTDDADVINEEAMRLLDELTGGRDGLFAKGHGLRLIGVGGSSLDDGSYEQVSLFDWAEENLRREEQREKEELRRAQEAEIAERRAKMEKAAERKREKEKRLREMLDTASSRYGKNVIKKGF